MNATRLSPLREILIGFSTVAHASSLCDFKQNSLSTPEARERPGQPAHRAARKGKTGGLPRAFPRTGVRGRFFLQTQPQKQ